MLLAQVADVGREVTHVIDARLVGGLVALIMVGFLPLVKWLGGLAVANSITKVTGLETSLVELKRLHEATKDRMDGHGRKLEFAARDAEHAYNKAVQVERAAAELTTTTTELKKDVERIDGMADAAMTSVADVSGGLAELSEQHGRLHVRVERAEKDIEKNTDQLRAHELAQQKGGG